MSSIEPLTLERVVGGEWGNSLSTGASEPGMTLRAYPCSTREAEAGGLGIQVQPALGGKVPESPGLLEIL